MSTGSPMNKDSSPVVLPEWGFKLRPWLAQDLHQVVAGLSEYLDMPDFSVLSLLDSEFMSQAKHVRPLLFLLCTKLLNYSGDERIKVAVICEYIHVASLLHDDVVDESKIRRGKPACHVVWDKATSVLVGDYIYARACELISEVESHSKINGFLQVFAQAIRMMSEGELMQLEYKGGFPTVEQYLAILERKTGALLGAATQAAWLLGQGSKAAEDSKASLQGMWDLGILLGTAYQLLDDVFDYSAHQETLGKPILQDLKEGKASLPLILLMPLVTHSQKTHLHNILSSGAVEKEQQRYILSLLQQHGTVESTRQLAGKYIGDALAMVEQLFVPSDDRLYLESLVRALLKRES
ncbi:MAG: polyprenyl synthetase family protein [Proteobacteria bacterium]|nr:polyprenyl synthetase family protein [Pseudomonadota bacterium]